MSPFKLPSPKLPVDYSSNLVTGRLFFVTPTLASSTPRSYTELVLDLLLVIHGAPFPVAIAMPNLLDLLQRQCGLILLPEPSAVVHEGPERYMLATGEMNGPLYIHLGPY